MKKTNIILLITIILLLLAIITVLCLFAFGGENNNQNPQPVPSPAPSPEVSVDWQSIYKDFLSKQEYVYYASVADLNFDGVPELLLSYTGASASASLNIYEIIDEKLELRSGYDEAEHINNTLAEKNYHLRNSNPPESLPSYFPYEQEDNILKKNVKDGTYVYMWHSQNGNDTESFETYTIFNPNSETVEIDSYFYKNKVYDYETEAETVKYIANGKECSEQEYIDAFQKCFDNLTDSDYPRTECGIKIGEKPLPKGYIVLKDGKMTERDIDTLFENYIPETEYFKTK